MDFKALLNTVEYDFIRINLRLGSRIMLLGVSGSHGYGTNREGSDIDFRGVTLNLPSDLIGLTSFDQYEDPNTDTVIYSFTKLVNLLMNCNPNTIEILGLDDDQNVIKTVVGQEEELGDEYHDYQLVLAGPFGTPMESSRISVLFNQLIKEHDLPKVVFHSLRHSSITYKLKLNGGDMKSVQGDSGHAQLKMVADVYSHIIDEDRCINAQRMEQAFYSTNQAEPAEEAVADQETTVKPDKETAPSGDRELVEKLLANPEAMALLKSLAKAL